MKILLVNPLVGAGALDRERIDEFMYPYSLLYLSNYLLKNSFETKIYDCYMHNRYSLEDTFGIENPDIIGFTGVTQNRFEVLGLAKLSKFKCPNATIVVGGKHFTFTDEETLLAEPTIDVVVRGEGEETLLDLVRTLEGGQALGNVHGITYRKSGAICRNQDRVLNDEIEKYAIDYDLLPSSNYSNTLIMRNYEKEKLPAIPLLLGRGCSQGCVFCTHNKFRYRVRPLDSLIREIVGLKRRYNCSNFSFNDPSFCERRSFVEAFCHRLIRDRIDIQWYCEGRVDTPNELLILMRRAGCISLDFALESGSDKVLKAIKKQINTGQVVEFAKKCSDLGIRTLAFTMVSLPAEDQEDARKTLEMIRRLSNYCHAMTLAVTQILPGTELEQMAYEKGILSLGFNWYDHSYSHGCPDHFGPKTIPLYLENLDIAFIDWFYGEFQSHVMARHNSLREIALKMVKGIKQIPNQSAQTSWRKFKAVACALTQKLKRLQG